MNTSSYLIIILILVIIIYVLMDCMNYENGSSEFIQLIKDYTNLLILKSLINKTNKILIQKEITYWISGTTLLSAEKQGLLPWTDTADFCIMENETNKLVKIKKLLKNNNLGMVEWFGGYKIYDLTGIKIINKNYRYPFVDIFICIEMNNKIVYKSKIARDLWTNEYINSSSLFPLKLYKFEDIEVYGPNDTNDYLNRVFPNWKTRTIGDLYYIKNRSINKKRLQIIYNTSVKPYLWQYWDTLDGKEIPSYINLSFQTVDKHCSNSFNIVRLNKDNIYDYIPEIKKYEPIMNSLIIAHKVDIYRILLLFKYGGLYMDADTICMRDPIEIIDKLATFDFVGFGCTMQGCQNGYREPSNWVLASRPNGILMSKVLQNLLYKLNTQTTFDYHDLGKLVIWEELGKLINNYNYKYFHYPSKVDGSRDKNGLWIDSDVIFSNTKIDYEDENNFIFYVFYSTGMSPEIKNLNEEELLNKDWNYTKFLKKSLF